MKKLLLTFIAAIMAVGLIACGSSSSNNSEQTTTENTSTQQEKTSVTIKSLNGSKEEVDLEVPYNPKRIAILDFASLDIIDSLGVGERVVGMASTSIDYLKKYSDNTSIKSLGTIKEADFEAVMECEPDIIFIGGRLSNSYDKLSEIAPVVYLSTDTEIGLVESVSKNAKTIASIFGLESEVGSKLANFTERINNLKNFAQSKTALVGMTTSGSFNLLGNDGRCSIIGREIGFNNLTAASSTSTHGNESSFETVVSQNPDYIFVMDRDSAIATSGAKTAKEIMENDLVMSTDAYKNNHIVYLEHPNVWYTAEGGIQALDIMLQDLETGLK
jgi:iron complex transport system substrate-binding protein